MLARFVIAAAVLSCLPPVAGATDPPRLADALLEDLRAANNVPGMAAAVWHQGKLVWHGETGFADLETSRLVRPSTQFRLASVSKVFAATGAALLAERGTLDLDADIRLYVPAFPSRANPITTRDLAAHLSGIPHYQAVDAGRGRIRYTSVADALAVFADRELLFPPGTGYNYSSYGYTLLSAVIEAAAGEDYLSFVRHRLTGPAGLQETGAEDAARPGPALTRMYELSDGVAAPVPPHDYSYSWAGAGMRGTARDLVRFGAAVLDGRLVSAETLDMMLTPARTDSGETVGSYYYRVGFGWRTGSDHAGRRVVHHAGVTPGARSVLLLYPDEGTAVALLSNASWTSQIERAASLLAAPFLDPAPETCPSGGFAYDGEFDEKPVTGSLTIVEDAEGCHGTLSAENALGEWLRSFPQRGSEAYTLRAITSKENAVVFALVTPLGIADLPVVRHGQDLRAETVFGRSRKLRIGARRARAPASASE